MDAVPQTPNRIAVSFPQALLEQIDDHRRQLPTIPSRAQAIRSIVEQALAAQPTTNPPAKAARATSR